MFSKQKIASGIIAIEGLDGTGKSTLGELLAEKFRGLSLHTPDSIYDEVRKKLHNKRGTSAFFMYLSSCAYALEIHRTSNSPYTFIDRFWFSSILEHCWKENLSHETIHEYFNIMSDLLPRPQITIVLFCAREERLRRLKQRGELERSSCVKNSEKNRTLPDPEEWSYESFWNRGLQYIQKLLDGDCFIDCDTTVLKPSELIVQLSPQMEKYL